MKREVNIIVMGKTGAGKSTLINSYLGEDIAPTGVGQAVTKENKVYEFIDGKHKAKIRLLDTVGLELDCKITQNTINNIEKHIKEIGNNEDDITLVWFCVNQNSSRFENYEISLIRSLAVEKAIPFLIVLTQSYDDRQGELENQIRRDLKEVTCIRVLAKDYESRIGTFPAYGTVELLERSISEYKKLKIHILESKLEELAVSRKELIKEIKTKGSECIKSYSKKAGKAGLVGLAGTPFVHGDCAQMINQINRIAGLGSGKGLRDDLIADFVVGIIATPLMSVPLFGSLVAQAYIESIGDSYLTAVVSVVSDSNLGELRDNELMTARIKEELEKQRKN